MLLDGWRLAVGTLTAIPVRPPSSFDRRRAAAAMVLAPLAVAPVALSAAALVWAGREVAAAPLVVAVLVIGCVVVSNRAFHLDGLSDTVDGLAASHDAERSLKVMKSGTSGPAGTAAVVLVVMLQIAGVQAIAQTRDVLGAAVVVGLAVMMSRSALSICCVQGVRHARDDGLGHGFASVIAPGVALLSYLLGAALLSWGAWWADLPWWRGPVAALAACVITLGLLWHTRRRFGGVTGDVFGAAIELHLATLLVCLS